MAFVVRIYIVRSTQSNHGAVSYYKCSLSVCNVCVCEKKDKNYYYCLLKKLIAPARKRVVSIQRTKQTVKKAADLLWRCALFVFAIACLSPILSASEMNWLNGRFNIYMCREKKYAIRTKNEEEC